MITYGALRSTTATTKPATALDDDGNTFAVPTMIDEDDFVSVVWHEFGQGVSPMGCDPEVQEDGEGGVVEENVDRCMRRAFVDFDFDGGMTLEDIIG